MYRRRRYRRRVVRRRVGGRRYVRKRRFAPGKTVINRTAQPIAPRFITKLHYSETLTHSSTSTLSDTQYRLNSIFDPSFAIGGHQPYGHDTLQTLYNRYRVFAAYVTVKFFNSSTAVPLYVTAIPSNVTSSITTTDLAAESPYARNMIATSTKPAIARFKVNLPKVTGVSNVQYKTDDRFAAVFGADPTEVINLHLVHSVPTGTVPVYSQVNITYYVECWDPHELAQS